MRPAIRYPLPLPLALRLRHGLAWARPLPGMREIIRLLHLDAPALRLLAVLLVAYGIVGSIDYTEALRQEAEVQQHEAARQAGIAQTATARLADCLNGTARWMHDNGSGQGYGKTLIECQRALEMRL